MDSQLHDGSPYNLLASNTSIKVVQGGVRFDPKALHYDMSGDKYLLIFNHYKYQNSIYYKNNPPSTRKGTHCDVEKLEPLFRSFGFNVTVHHDLEYDQIHNKLTELAAIDHRNTSCICITILTHGDTGGELKAANKPYLLSDILHVFESSPGLVNKPKLFFVQACRGSSEDKGYTVQLDSENILTVPTFSDTLVLYSTVKDHVAYRDELNGTWMIQELCIILTTYHRVLDLLHMITLLNQKVAYIEYPLKQTPDTRFTLTKLLRFS
ncbi:caspase-1-like isoform X2 [Anticarsia gemmatalis]|uniref:caspase-1-like isoform X2 n=1 Tax=Anticarsia gemmatalis TaxID=129554 RepID=UPI003F75DC30